MSFKNAIALAALSVAAVSANATPILVSPDDVGNRGTNTITYGTTFTVGATNIVVDSIGAWDAGNNGLLESHAVGVWDASGTLLVSETVPAGSVATLIDGWRYVSISSGPFTLLANTQYVMGGHYTGGSSATCDYVHDSGDPIFYPGTTSDFTIGTGVSFSALTGNDSAATYGGNGSGALTFPGSNGGEQNGRWAGANLTLVPEPTMLGLVGTTMLLAMRRRRA